MKRQALASRSTGSPNEPPILTEAPTRWVRLLLKSLGPGIITGADGDDPSGIATYSVAGAQLGTKLLMMCARIGEVTGKVQAEISGSDFHVDCYSFLA